MLNLKRLLVLKNLPVIFIILLFFVSFAVRLIWVLYVQQPGLAIYSDMAGYVERAQALVSGTQGKDRFLGLMPYGTHYFYTLEMFLFGKENYTALAVVNAFLGAACVVCVSLVARYCLKSALAIIIVGILSCIWYPFISYNGYFSSEIPYSLFLYLGLIITFKYLNSGKYGLLTGLLYGIAFTIRPQMIMTFILFVCWIIFRRKHFNKLKIRSLCTLVLPVVIIVGYSMYRYHYFTGKIGLISGNVHLTKLFGRTNYSSLECYMTQNGKVVGTICFAPLTSSDLGFDKHFRFEGHMMDDDIIKGLIESHQSNLPFWQKTLHKMRNITLLAYNTEMWPERCESGEHGWRRFVFETWHTIIKIYWFPLACIGFLSVLSLKNPYLEVPALHIFTMFYVAYAYWGMMRYRVPYDLLLILFAVQGGALILSLKTDTSIAVCKEYSEDCNSTYRSVDTCRSS